MNRWQIMSIPLIRFVKFTAFSILASNMRQLQGSAFERSGHVRRVAAAYFACLRRRICGFPLKMWPEPGRGGFQLGVDRVPVPWGPRPSATTVGEQTSARSLWGITDALGNGGTTGVCWNETT